MYRISRATKKDYPELIQVWEASVRATHEFLKEEDIQHFKPLILDKYFDMVDLWCVSNQNVIQGFIGIANQCIEMLFIHPDHRGKHIGSELADFAVTEYQANKVEVNEDNPQAVGFYEKLGFVATGRKDRDHSGKPYPLLEMTLKRD
jgi:putative acetyltransferase